MYQVQRSHYRKKHILSVYKCPNQEPDTRIKLFNYHELHVHSSILRKHSKFFQLFLSAGTSPAPDSQWKIYLKASRGLDDRWYLVDGHHEDIQMRMVDDIFETFKNWSDPHERAQRPMNIERDVQIIKLAQKFYPAQTKPRSRTHEQAETEEVEEFTNMINAMYNIPYWLETAPQFNRLTSLAEFYGCLPAVSNSLNTALSHSPTFVRKMPNRAHLLIESAYKLRHKDLFNDCAILLSGLEPIDTLDLVKSDSEIGRIVLETRVRTRKRMFRVQKIAMLREKEDETLVCGGRKEEDEVVLEWAGNMVVFHRQMVESLEGRNRREAERTGLLGNELVLVRDAEAGKGLFKWYFLCGALKDGELPWDMNQKKW